MSVVGSGRPGLLQLAAPVVAQMALWRWRTSPDLLCTPGPVSRRATGVRLVRAARAGADRAVVGLDTSEGRSEDSVPPATALGGRLTADASDGLGELLDWFDLELDGLATRVVDDGRALALGLGFDGVSEDRAAWDGFDRSLLADADWSLTLDGAVLARRLSERFAARAAQLGATLHAGSPRVEWGERIYVFATGDFTVPGYGSHNFELVVWYRFVFERGMLRVRRSPLASGDASADRPGWSSDYGVENFGRELADAAFDAATDPDELFPPIRLAFGLGGGHLTARSLIHGARTLRISGDADVPAEVVAPRLEVDQSTRTFHEEAFSQCGTDRAPAFSLQRVELRAGPGGVRLCGAVVEGAGGLRILTVDRDALHPAPDGRSLADTPAELAPNSSTTLILGYVGDRAPAHGGLRIVSTDPRGLLRTVPLQLVAGGRAAAELHPDVLDIVVGNAADGRRATLGSDCFPIETTPAPSRPDAPDGRLVLENTGEAPVAVCQVRAEHDPADPASRYVFDASWSGNYVVLPRHSGTVEIRFYPPRPRGWTPRDLTTPPRVTDHVFRATIVVELGGALRGHPLRAQVTGRVEPRPVTREIPARGGGMRAGFDPRRDAVCMPRPDVDLCDLERYFEPVGPPEALVVADVRVRGAADGAVVTLLDHDDGVHVRDLGEGPERRFDVGPGPTGRRACTPRVDGGRSPRIEVRHAVVAPGPSAPVPNPRCVVEHAGRLWVGTRSGLVVLDVDELAPGTEQAMGSVHGLAAAGGLVWAALDDRLVAIDPARPDRIVTSVEPGARIGAVAASPAGLVVATGSELRTVTLDAEPAFGRPTVLPEPARWLVPVPAATVAVGTKSVSVARAGRALRTHPTTFPVTSVSALGSRVLLHGDGIALAVVADAAVVRPVAEYPLGHWQAPFAPEPRGGLYELTDEGLRRWEIGRRRLDAAVLPEAYAPRYLRIRPDGLGE
ncbi:hypothetical protein [Pseudonocardia sp. D17]|uniref:hypothetical protein n=1 Tax=Pseudonocardia sp. D17 TaxID=882661 RepID=UPI002B3F5337|nr:hypothetical protein PSD17_09120 [Pseudonocardia sp. D17]